MTDNPGIASYLLQTKTQSKLCPFHYEVENNTIFQEAGRSMWPLKDLKPILNTDTTCPLHVDLQFLKLEILNINIAQGSTAAGAELQQYKGIHLYTL